MCCVLYALQQYHDMTSSFDVVVVVIEIRKKTTAHNMHLFKWTITWDILWSLVTVFVSYVCSLCTLLSEGDAQFMEMSIENSVAQQVRANANKVASLPLFKANIFVCKTRIHSPRHQEMALVRSLQMCSQDTTNETKSAIIPQGNFQRAIVVKKLRFIMGFIHSK